jgi:uncharacterized membrane protein
MSWLRVLTWIYIAFVVVIAGVGTAFYLHSEGDPNYAPYDALGTIVTFTFFGGGLLGACAYIFCVVLVCRVTYRMMRNLHQLGASQARISPGWAVGWYFIPFANLVMPVRAVTQIWHGTFGELNTPREPGGMIGLWWACWLISNFADSIGSQIMGESNPFVTPMTPSSEQLYAGLALYNIGYLASVLAALLMLRLFDELTSAQKQLVSVTAFR